MLRREHDLRYRHRLRVLVAHRDLTFGVGSEFRSVALSSLSRLGQRLEDLVAVVDRRGHQLGRLAAGISKHDALIACAFLLVGWLLGIDALGDIGRLRVKQDLDVGLFPMESGLLVADVADRHARDMRNPVLGHRRRPARLAGDDDAVGGRECLACGTDLPGVDAGGRALAIEQVDDLVRDAVADLVGMPFRDGFAREEVGLAGHTHPL